MNNFDKVIGYETIKTELLQICDMIHNREVYENLGAKLPCGVLLYGAPGLGKTLMANCLIEECGLKAYTIRRNKETNSFVEEITDTFRKAKENAPSVIFLDDMDKFANEDEGHRDAEEYVAVQSGIDEVRGFDVFVLATVNDKRKLPGSLIRSGRFDRKIEMHRPTQKDATAIIAHYLKSKKIDDDINMEDVSMMISYSSCAELETILNEAAIIAAFERRTKITMNDIVSAVLRKEYNSFDNHTEPSEEDLRKIALHEAGHLVVCEVLCEGSVGLASIRKTEYNSIGGFIHKCKDFRRDSYDILVSLAGKAAVELYYSDTPAEGCWPDIHRAAEQLNNEISSRGACGLGLIDITTFDNSDASEDFKSKNEAVTYAELERYMLKARSIILKNREFLEKVTEALLEKETLLYSDIKKLRENITIISVSM